MKVCNVEKVDEIRDHVRDLMAPKKPASNVQRVELPEHQKKQDAAIELEPVKQNAGSVRVYFIGTRPIQIKC